MRASSSKIPTSVRFTPKTESRLASVSEHSGIPVKKLIEVFVDLGLSRVEEAGMLSIPLGAAPKNDDERIAQEKTVDALISAAENSAQPAEAGKARKPKGK